MNRDEVTKAISDLIENFQNLPRDEKLTFLTFNQYHHKRSINEVVSIYVQNPEARLLGSFDYWKNLSTESSVAFGQKASVRIWNKYGRVKETLYDVSQTTLREDLHLPDTIIEERVLVNTLAEIVNREYLLGDFQQQEFNVFASQYINEYIDKTVPSLPNYTEAQKALALSIAKFNIFEEFGAFLEDDNDYQAFVQTILNDFDKLPAEESLLRTFALANNFSQEFSRQILANYERVANLTEERLEKQEQLHQKLEELEPHINFEGTTPPAIETSTATLKSAAAEIEWNESSSNEIFEFINRSHEHTPINRSVLEAMIRDEIKLEELNETGYYKVETTLGRIYLGDGFESNKQLYQALSDDNELNIDVQFYYDSIAPEKVQQLSIKEVLQQVRDKMNLPESFKVKSIGSSDFAIMKETLGGILNEPIVDWYQEGGIEVKENAPKLTENPFFEKEFNLYLDEVLEDFKTSIQDETIISENEPSDKELLQEIFKRGSGFSQGKLRIQYYFSEHEFNFSKTKAVAFLKEEMGIGGHGEKLLQYSYDSQGLKIKNPVDRNFSWVKAVDYLSETVFSGQYLTPTEQLDYQTWKNEPKNIEYAKARWQEPLPTPEKEVQDEISLFDFDEGFAETVIPESELHEKAEERSTETVDQEKVIAEDVSKEITDIQLLSDEALEEALVENYGRMIGADGSGYSPKSFTRWAGLREEENRRRSLKEPKGLSIFDGVEDESQSKIPTDEQLDQADSILSEMLEAVEQRKPQILSEWSGGLQRLQLSQMVGQNREVLVSFDLQTGRFIPSETFIDKWTIDQREILRQRLSEVMNIPYEVKSQLEFEEQLNNTTLVDFEFPEVLSEFYPKTTTEKVNANLQAIKLVKKLDIENRGATPAEQNVLAKYVGWGGLANTFFDESNPRFQEERETLKALVTSKEYGQMRKSSLTAYFTDPDIITHLYRQISDLGFEGGRVLDPSMESGNFFSAMPRNLKEKSDLYGVELETLSGQLSKQLHQTANIQVKGFETTTFANDSMDLVITNVPFGQTYLTDDKYEKNYAIHDYFIKKALDLVHEGGFVAVITSTYTMDKQNDSFRKELSKQANLVGAVRLPDSAFKNIAGTDVCSDILIFQKTSSPELNPVWLDTVKQSDALGNVVAYNRYFEQFPDKVLGDLKIKTFNGGTLSIQNKSNHDDLMNALDVALNFEGNQNITTLERQPEVFEVAKSNDESIPVEVLENIAPFTLYVHNNRPYYHNGKTVERHQKTSSINLKVDENRKNQLERYERNKDKIFDQKEKFVVSYVGKGYFDSWDNFIPTTSEGKNNLPDIDADTLKKIAQNNAAFSNDKRYNFNPKTSQLTIESLESTQYFYHVDYNKADVKAIEQMIDLRQTLHEVLSVQHQPNFQEEYEPLREMLNQKYDAFVAQYGAISSRNNHSLMKKDDYYQFLASIEDEVEDEKTKLPKYVKGTVFFEPTIQVEKGVVEVNSASDALLASLNHRGKLDFDYMKDIYPHTKEEMVAELGDRLFYLGADEYQVREDYLSGDVKTKLSIAKSNRDFDFEGYDWTRNISALEKVIPKDLMISEINFKLGTRFIPTSIYQKFFAEVLDQKNRGTQEPKPEFVTIEYDKEADVYHVELEITHTYAVTDKYGYKNYSKNQSYPADRLATTLLNQRAPKLYQPDPDDPTGRKRILDSDATASIQEKGVALATQFEEWVMKTPEIQAEIVKVYNERYNRSVVKVYDGQQLTINGLATQYQLRPHQQNAVMRIIQERRAGLAHEVGSGKTLTMLAASMKLQELGVISKPMFVIPKPLVDQFAREIYKYFPESKVLVATSEDFTKEHRKRFISRIANGSYNAIVIADSQFGKVAMSREYQEYYINNELNLAREVLENSDSESKYTVKRIEKKIEGLEKRLENLQKTDTDTFINFEELGIDFLFVDEAHNYKNLAPYTQLENVKGVSDTRSQKALDLMMKVEYLHNLYDNRNVVLSTGTPMSNSVVELYTMMKYVEPDVLERYGVENFDSWVSSFGIIEDNFELTAAGTFKINRRFTKFGNVPELMKMFRESWDIQTAEMLDLPVPKAETLPHYTTATSTQAKYIDDLVTRATMIENGEVKPYEDNMLKIVGENRKLTLDMRALDDSVYSEMDSDKLNQVVDNVYQIYKDNDDKKSTQMIFSDLSVPYKYRNSQTFNSDGSINTFSAYDEIKRQLVLKGIPEHEIRFIHEATDKNKETMMREMRTGKIRVLLGSTGKAGTGLNVQDKLIAVHHLDVPWRPSDIAQRNGRIIRQGNENPLVQIHHYITKNSMDSFLWQTQEVKQKFIEQIMSGNSNAREMEELATDTPSPAIFKASANGNPLQAEFMKLEMELQVLKRSRTRFYEGKATDKNRIPEEQNRLSSFERRLVSIEKDLSNISDNKDKPFSLELSYNGEKKYFNEQDKKSDIGKFFAKRLNGSVLKFQASVDRVGTVSLGYYRGFELLHSVTTSHEGMEDIILKGNAQYSVRVDTSAPTGILTRIDNKIDEGITRDYDNTLTEIDRLKNVIQKIQAEEDAPFPKEEEYLEKMTHYNDLQESLKAERSGKVRDVSNDYKASEEMEM